MAHTLSAFVYRISSGELVCICNGAIGRVEADSQAVAEFLALAASGGAELIGTIAVPPSRPALPVAPRWRPSHRRETRQPHLGPRSPESPV